MSTIDQQIGQLKTMSATLTGIGCSIDDLRAERDLLRAENARMQIEIQRLTLKLEQALQPQT